MDEVIQVVDPVDRESSFLETAAAWKDLMLKGHGEKQSYDEYWSEYSSLVVKYAYSHGDIAKSPAVQELTALLCVLNARLNRTDFSMVLQAAMTCETKLCMEKPNRMLNSRGGTPTTGPMSARQVLSQVSGRRGSNFEDDSANVTHRGDVPEGSNAKSDARDLIATLSAEFMDMQKRNDAVLEKLTGMLSTLEGVDDSQDLVSDLKEIRVKVNASELSRKSCVNVVSKLNSVDFESSPSVKNVTVENDDDYKPIITMESVRVALRRLDFGDNALSGISTDSAYSSKRSALTILDNDTTRSQLAQQMKGKCWVCYGNHLAFQNPTCREKLMKMRGVASLKSSRDDDAIDDAGRNKPSVSKLSWGEEQDGVTRSGITMLTKASLMVNVENCDIIVDGGANATVIGWRLYIELCYQLNILPEVYDRQKTDPKFHAFGTKENSSELQEIVGRCNIPVPIGKGRWLGVRALVVNGEVQIIMGKDSLITHGAVEHHRENKIKFKTKFGVVTLRTTISGLDGHARIVLGGLSASANVAESIMDETRSHKPGDDREGRNLVKRIHARTHIHPETCEMLLKRAGKWSKGAATELEKTVQSCYVCKKSGEPQRMNKFSISKLNRQFNDVVEIDVMYWGKTMMLHAVDTCTGYSELAVVSNRRLNTMLPALDKMWCLRHGAPVKFKGDQEFDKEELRKWMKSRGCVFVPVPSRRHNKTGVVERKNRVVKDALEKLDIDAQHARLNMRHKLSLAQFTSNILYGGKLLSAFEQVRGYTPSIEGTGKKGVPSEISNAFKEMEARRLLARMLKSMPRMRYPMQLQVVQPVLVLLPGGKRPRGHWNEETVSELNDNNSVVVGKGRNRKVIAYEDIRVLPKSELAKSTVHAEHGVVHKCKPKRKRKSEKATALALSGDEKTYDSEDEPKKLPPVQTSGQAQVSETSERKAATGGSEADSDESESSISEEADPVDDSNASEEDNQMSVVDNAPRTRYGRKVVAPVRYTGLVYSLLDTTASEQKYLELAYDQFRGGQFYAREAPFLPKFLLERADREELEKNWSPNMVEVDEKDVPSGANVIGSHFVYKVKVEHELDAGSTIRKLKLKSRLCVHGNKDDERESMRTDAAVVSHFGFRMVYSMACMFGMVIGQGDARGAYTQSGDAKRAIYVRPPFRVGNFTVYWLLKTTSYGIVSAGRKWQRKSDGIVQRALELSLVIGMPQLFVQRSDDGTMLVLLAKYVDDFLCAARNEVVLSNVHKRITQAVELGSWKQWPDVMDVNSTEVVQTVDYVSVSAKRLKSEVEVVVLSPSRRKNISAEVTDSESRSVRSMAGKLGYIGVAVSPLASFAASYVQQILPKMTVAGVKHSNGIAKDILRRDIKILYIRPTPVEVRRARIAVFTDAGYPHQGVEKKVAQEGCLVGVAFGTHHGAPFHSLGWISRKQRRVSNSSLQAECIAAVTGVGMATHAAKVWKNATNMVLPLTIVVDSLGLHRTVSTQATPTDMGSAHDIHALRVDYESGLIDAVSWVAGKMNPADPLTKPHAGETAGILTEMLATGRLPCDINVLRCYGKALQEEQ